MLGANMWVRQTVGVHKPFIRAIELVLRRCSASLHLGMREVGIDKVWMSGIVSRQRRRASIAGRGPGGASVKFAGLDGRNRARVIAESLARVIAAIRITSVRWRSYLSLKPQKFGPRRPCVRCTAVRIARLAFVGECSFHVDLRNGLRELKAAFAEH